MSLGLLGKKRGMTQIFDEGGAVIPVTVIEVGPCTVVQKKTLKTDGYNALQIGFGTQKAHRVNKALKGHVEKKGLKTYFKTLKEARILDPEQFVIGQQITVQAFQAGDLVDVQGFTKGRGFQGVIKKEGKHGGPDGHGSGFHRRPGSIGMRTWPGRVMKNMGMPGRMGQDKVMLRHLTVAGVQPEENLLLVKGAVPGARNDLVVVYNREKDFEARYKKVETKTETPAEAPKE